MGTIIILRHKSEAENDIYAYIFLLQSLLIFFYLLVLFPYHQYLIFDLNKILPDAEAVNLLTYRYV